MPGTRKMGRPTAHRNAMLRGMVTLLIDKERIETTVTRAKDLRAVADRMISLGKQGDLAAKRMAMQVITKEEVVKKLFDQLAPSYADREGGYTRVLKIGPRRGDGAEMAIIEFVGREKAEKADETKKGKSGSAKKSPAKAAAAKKTAETKKDDKPAKSSDGKPAAKAPAKKPAAKKDAEAAPAAEKKAPVKRAPTKATAPKAEGKVKEVKVEEVASEETAAE